MTRRIITTLTLILSLFSLGYSDTLENPVDLLNKTIVTTQNELMENSDKYQEDPYALIKLVDKNILPIIDTNVIAQLVVTPTKWNSATPQEQQEFIKSSTEMLTFMYVRNVATAGKYKISLFPFTNDSWKNKSLVIVNGKITNIGSNKSSDFSVKMFKKKNGSGWSVYDFNVAGVSIVETYKQQFAGYPTLLKINEAIEKTTNKIKEKNYPDLLNKEA